MLRKVLNLVVVIAVIIAISGIFIHLYNTGKKESLANNANTKIASKEKKDNNKKNNTTENKSKENNNSTESKDEEQEETNKAEDEEYNEETSEEPDEEEDNNETANEIAVSSTASFNSIYIEIIGATIIISGVGYIILNIKKKKELF